MAYRADIILDSVAPNGHRLTTFALTYPRIVHAEFMTHRMFSRNASSSRAIPTEKLIDLVADDPFQPVYWGKNQSGMQAKQTLSLEALEEADRIWKGALNCALDWADQLREVGAHKQIVNRLLEPFSWITVICSATEYGNFFAQRCHPDAQPEIQKLAYMMLDAYQASTPTPVKAYEWHIPFITDEDRQQLNTVQLRRVSVARCARVSYLNHEGTRDIQKDIDLSIFLEQSGHWTPFEHVAEAMPDPVHIGNLTGWMQYRKYFGQENRTYASGRPS